MVEVVGIGEGRGATAVEEMDGTVEEGQDSECSESSAGTSHFTGQRC